IFKSTRFSQGGFTRTSRPLHLQSAITPSPYGFRMDAGGNRTNSPELRSSSPAAPLTTSRALLCRWTEATHPSNSVVPERRLSAAPLPHDVSVVFAERFAERYKQLHWKLL